MIPATVVTVKTDLTGDTATLQFKGDITGVSEEIVVASYKNLSQSGLKHIVLDFNQSPYLNSSGIAAVIQIMIGAQKAGQDVECTGLTPHFIKVFNLMALSKYAKITGRN